MIQINNKINNENSLQYEGEITSCWLKKYKKFFLSIGKTTQVWLNGMLQNKLPMVTEAWQRGGGKSSGKNDPPIERQEKASYT